MSLLLFYVVLIVMFVLIIYIILNLICECSGAEMFCSSFCIFSFVPYWEPTLLFLVSRFVKYTGYGNAAGLLATRGLLGGQGPRTSDTQYSSDSDSDTEEYRQVKDRINPVTGRVEAEQPDPMEGMTEEEKEEEAKRLIMLFNKLSR